MKKLSLCLLLACILCSALVFSACSSNASSSIASSSSTEKSEEAIGVEVAQADLEKMIIGKWITADVNDEPVLTNDKMVITFTTPTNATISASLNSRPELGSPWIKLLEADVAMAGNDVTLTWPADERTTIVDELSVSSITDTEIQGSLIAKSIIDGKETVVAEETISLEKVNDDYRKDILGTWEGRCTSEGSAFDDGQDHRWEYKADGTYVYYKKEGGNWVPSDDTLNEYFVDGNLLCTRWGENGAENREWWEISIDSDTMNWTALREGDNGTTYTASFEMKKVEG